jgi:formyl-CoA transferase
MIDFTHIEQGPVGTQVLADFGVDVIKVERIDTGERFRAGGPKFRGMNSAWLADNRNKRSLTLDLKKPEATQIIHRLVETFDIVANNFRPGVMDRLGLGYEELKAINPRIIWAAATGYGLTGPYDKRYGQDLLAQSIGGLMAMTGERDGPPTATGTPIADFMGAMLFAQGMMAALAARERTGRGQIVDSCLMNGMIVSHLQENVAVLNMDEKYPRPLPGGGSSRSRPFYAVYECKDGKYFTLMAGARDRIKERVSKALGIEPSLAEDPRWKDVDMSSGESWELRPVLEEAFKKFTRSELEERFEEQGLPPAPVYELDEVFRDPQVVHNDLVLELEHPAYGKVKVTGFPVKLSETPAKLRMSPPIVGEHNEEVLREAGYSDAEIRTYQEAGVVGSETLKRAHEAVAD